MLLQVSVSTRYEQRLEEGNLRNYGRLIVDLASVVPDGLVVFFVSYSYMDYVIARWHEDGLLEELMAHKLIFIETQVGCSRGSVYSCKSEVLLYHHSGKERLPCHRQRSSSTVHFGSNRGIALQQVESRADLRVF